MSITLPRISTVSVCGLSACRAHFQFDALRIGRLVQERQRRAPPENLAGRAALRPVKSARASFGSRVRRVDRLLGLPRAAVGDAPIDREHVHVREEIGLPLGRAPQIRRRTGAGAARARRASTPTSPGNGFFNPSVSTIVAGMSLIALGASEMRTGPVAVRRLHHQQRQRAARHFRQRAAEHIAIARETLQAAARRRDPTRSR